MNLKRDTIRALDISSRDLLDEQCQQLHIKNQQN